MGSERPPPHFEGVAMWSLFVREGVGREHAGGVVVVFFTARLSDRTVGLHLQDS